MYLIVLGIAFKLKGSNSLKRRFGGLNKTSEAKHLIG
jgi:hypothetical protein